MRGVLFDLDGTLLDVELQEFLGRYFKALDDAISPHFPTIDLVPAVLSATEMMHRPHPGMTNQETFARAFHVSTGVDLAEHWPVFDAFYRDVFPTLGAGYGPITGAREAIGAARSLGWRVVVATQPIFPRAAIEQRLAWAGLADVPFDMITTYEIMGACKPDAAYFKQVCATIGCAPADCVMVGDDPENDMGAGRFGITTFYVGRGNATADRSGTLRDLPAFFRKLDRA
jgi:FMN phosphatase YigB (HAD superfamily)